MYYHRSITPAGMRARSLAARNSSAALAGIARIDHVFGQLRSGARPSEARATELPVDLFEDDAHYFARFPLPGVKRERLELVAEGGVLTLTVRGEKKHDVIEADVSDVAERSVESEAEVSGEPEVTAGRALKFPQDADAEAVSAKLEDGLLTLTLPKKEEAKPRSIAIA